MDESNIRGHFLNLQPRGKYVETKLQQRLWAYFFAEKLQTFIFFNISVTAFLPQFFSPTSLLITAVSLKLDYLQKSESVIGFDLQSMLHASEHCINNMEV